MFDTHLYLAFILAVTILMLAATAVAGIVLAAFTIRRTLRLEHELPERYEEGVRTRQEFEQRRIAASRHAPGGQLIQATDEFVGVRGAL